MATSPIASLLLQAASAAAGAQQYPTGALYVVATPIGNLADLTLRAIHVLALADVVACEDTRVTAVLMRHLGLDKPLLAVHEHNEAQSAERVVEHLAAGRRAAYVSDAGTPAVSDPGARLVAAARAAGHRVVPIPGPSSVLAALSAAADVQAQGFRFDGFAGARPRDVAASVERISASPDCTVMFEAPHRIEALAAALSAALQDRPVTLCRELTKQFESIVTLPASALAGWLAADADRRRGEFVLVVHAQPGPTMAKTPEQARRWLAELMSAMPLKQAVALGADISGLPRNALYTLALELKSQG